jgi:sugar phosphate isomerase/epimerase
LEIGTYARTTEEVKAALEHQPDFIDLRMDLNYSLDFPLIRQMLDEADVQCTLHLPSSPEWDPCEVSRDITPFIDLGVDVGARLITFHTALSTLFYSDIVIDNFLQAIPLACDAAREANMNLAIENLGLYYTELMLVFDRCPFLKIALDIGHGQIFATRNRALSIVESFSDRILMVNVHDNNGKDMLGEVAKLSKKGDLTREEIRNLGHDYDTHLSIGKGSIDFDPIFRELKERMYDGKFLMMSKDQSAFKSEREKFKDMWLKA